MQKCCIGYQILIGMVLLSEKSRSQLEYHHMIVLKEKVVSQIFGRLSFR